jgi:pyruvate dehydrogenase kinase 2/3/4
MRTGRGEFLHKTYRDAAWKKDDKVATERVLLQVAGFLRHELPIRLAHRILDLEKVPLLRDMNLVMVVKVFFFVLCALVQECIFSRLCLSFRTQDLYMTSFHELLSVPRQVGTPGEEARFAAIVENIYNRHTGVLVQMVRILPLLCLHLCILPKSIVYHKSP